MFLLSKSTQRKSFNYIIAAIARLTRAARLGSLNATTPTSCDKDRIEAQASLSLFPLSATKESSVKPHAHFGNPVNIYFHPFYPFDSPSLFSVSSFDFVCVHPVIVLFPSTFLHCRYPIICVKLNFLPSKPCSFFIIIWGKGSMLGITEPVLLVWTCKHGIAT